MRQHNTHAINTFTWLSLFAQHSCVVLLLAFLGCATAEAADAEAATLIPSAPSIARVNDAARGVRLQYRAKSFHAVEVVTPQAFYDETELTSCRTRPQRFCTDLAKAEFEIKSLHFMVPSVPGLTSKSITFRHHAVIANYTFR